MEIGTSGGTFKLTIIIEFVSMSSSVALQVCLNDDHIRSHDDHFNTIKRPYIFKIPVPFQTPVSEYVGGCSSGGFCQ